jgi:hypothetical protein
MALLEEALRVIRTPSKKPSMGIRGTINELMLAVGSVFPT